MFLSVSVSVIAERYVALMSNVIEFSSRKRRTRSKACEHEIFEWRHIQLSVCRGDGSVVWKESDEEIDGQEGMSILFGDFDLTGCLPGVGAPGSAVLVYEPSRGGKARLELFPAGRWIEAVSGLWFTHDNERLLLSPADPLVVENLTR